MRRRYNLSGWERATASAVLVNDVIRLAERIITAQPAFRLAMEEAAAIARVKPIDLDKLMKDAPKDIRQEMADLRKKAKASVENIPG